jgi:DNA repair exonuclease SbcCD ATPase subunit
MPAKPNTSIATDAKVVKQLSEQVSKELGSIIFQLIDESSDVTLLKNEKLAIEKDLERRSREFHKSKNNGIFKRHTHQEGLQQKSLEDNQALLTSVNDKLAAKRESLRTLTIEKVSAVVPNIIIAGSKMIPHDGDLEKTCQGLTKQVDDLKKIAEIQRANINKVVQDQMEMQQERYKTLDDRNKQQQELSKRLDDLDNRHQQQHKSLTTTLKSIPANLTQKLGEIDSISKRVDTFNSLKIDLSKVKDDVAKDKKGFIEHKYRAEGIHNKVESHESIIHGSNTSVGLPATVIQLENGRDQLILQLSGMDDKLKQLKTRLQKVESKNSSSAPALSQDAGADVSITTLLSRVGSLEAKLAEISDLNGGIVTVDQLEGLAKDLRISHDTWAIKEKAEISEILDKELLTWKKELTAIKMDAANPEKRELTTKHITALSEIKNKMSVMEGLFVKKTDILPLIHKQVENSLVSSENRLVALANGRASLPQLAVTTTQEVPSQDRLVALRKEIMTIVETRQAMLDEAVEKLIGDQDATIKALQIRVKILEDSSLTTGLKPLTRNKSVEDASETTSLGPLTTRLEEMENSLVKTSAVLSEIQGRLVPLENLDISRTINALQRSTNSCQLDLRQAETDLHTTKTEISNLIAMVNTKTTELTIQQSTANAEHQTRFDSFTKYQSEWDNKAWARLDSYGNRLDSVDFNIASTDKRIQNLQTKEMAQHILGQLDTVYPQVRQCQDILVTLSDASTRLTTLARDAENLRAKVTELETKAGPNESNQIVQATLEELSAKFTKLEADSDSKQTRLDELQSFAAKLSDLDSLRTSLEALKEEISGTVLSVDMRVDDVTKELAELRSTKQKLSSASRTLRRPSSDSPVRSISSSNKQSSSRSQAVTQEQHQSSNLGQGDNSRKRKLNGSGNLRGSKTNGFNSPRKKHKSTPIPPDSDEEFEYDLAKLKKTMENPIMVNDSDDD